MRCVFLTKQAMKAQAMYDKPVNSLVHTDSAGHVDIENFGSLNPCAESLFISPVAHFFFIFLFSFFIFIFILCSFISCDLQWCACSAMPAITVEGLYFSPALPRSSGIRMCSHVCC